MEEEFNKYKDLAIQNCVFEIKGITNYHLDKEPTKGEIELFEQYLDKFDSLRLKKISYFILVELMQNIYRHGVQNQNYRIIVGQSEPELIFVSENLIIHKNKDKLVTEVDDINKLSDDIGKVKEYYQNKLREGAMCYAKGGAGLGIVDLVRKSGKRLLYNILDINDKESLFSLIVRIELKKNPEKRNFIN